MAVDANEAFDPGIRRVLEELRDLKIEMRDDRRRSDAATDAERQRAEADRQRAEADRHQAALDRERSDERFEHAMAATREAWADVRSVGQTIVKALIRQGRILEKHGRILESIDRKLGGRGNGHPRPNGGRA